MWKIKKEKEKENLEHNKYKNQQRGGVINIPPKDNNINNNNEEEDIDNLIDNIRDDRKVIRRKRTLHEPKNMEIIEEEKDENEEPFDREFKIESSEKRPSKNTFPQNKKIQNFAEKNPPYNNNTTNSKVETKYIGDKKVTTTTTTTTERGKDGEQKTVTTTVTEEIGGEEPPKFRNKFVKNIPFKSFGRKKYYDNEEFNIEKEMQQLEKDFDKEFGHLNLKSPIKPVFESTDDMFENEDDIDMPEGAVSIEVKQKTITDSKGNPVLIVHKTINYENGEKKTIIEKQNIVKK